METKDVIAAGRLRLGLTHQAFADKVGVSRGAVQQWEKGSTAPTRKHQPLIAKLLGITVAELLCVTTTPSPGQVAGADSDKSPDRQGAPTLEQAVEITLNALAASPHRAELKSLLGLLIDTDAPAYRQRLVELLSQDEQVQQKPISMRNQALIRNAA